MALTDRQQELVAAVDRLYGTAAASRFAGVRDDRWDRWRDGRGRMSADEQRWLGRLVRNANVIPRDVREAMAMQRWGPARMRRETDRFIRLAARGRRPTRPRAREWRDFIVDLDLDPDLPDLQGY